MTTCPWCFVPMERDELSMRTSCKRPHGSRGPLVIDDRELVSAPGRNLTEWIDHVARKKEGR